jgi:RHS repeat-associated protein
MFSNDSGGKRRLRRLALGMAACLTWCVTGPSVGAAVAATRKPEGFQRTLSVKEMEHIRGTQSGTHALSLSAFTGPAYPWQGDAGDVNTGNGNKLTELSLVSWEGRGGNLDVAFTLYHNSQGNASGSSSAAVGPKWSHTYDIGLAVDSGTGDVTLTWGNGRVYTFVKNIDDTYTSPTGIYDRLTYDGYSAYTLTTKGHITYTFTSLTAGWFCDTIADWNGNTITISRNSSNGRVTTVEDPSGRTLTLGYTSSKLTSVTDPLSRVWTISYNGTTGDLTEVDYPAVGPSPGVVYSTGFGYSTTHNITTLTDRRGKNWTYAYNSDNSLAWAKNPLTEQTTFTYRSGYTDITNPRNATVRHNFASGRLSSVVDALSNTESYTYDSANNRTEIDDRRGKTWSFTYDARGNRLTETDPLLHTTTYYYYDSSYYLAEDRLATRVSDLGKYKMFYWSSTNGNLTAVNGGISGQYTSIFRDSYGQVIRVTDPNLNVVEGMYDTNGNLITNKRELVALQPPSQLENNEPPPPPEYLTASAAYDGLGRTTSVTDATGRTTTIDHDALSRVTEVIAPGNRTTTYTYDGEGNILTCTHPDATSDTYTYDDAGRRISHTDPLGRTVEWTYDAAGNRTVFTDGEAHDTDYTFNLRDELTRIDYPDSTYETFTYNATGDLSTKTTALGTITHSYDDAGRLTGKSYTGGMSSVSFDYDDDDRLIEMTDGSGTTDWTWDDDNRLTSRSDAAGTVSYAYDYGNRVTSRTIAGTSVTTFTYDKVNRLTEVTAPLAGGSLDTTYTYDDADRLLTTTLPNGNVETRTYDTDADLSSVVVEDSSSTVLSSQSYTYDTAGRRDTETLPGSIAIDYDYDAAGQLVQETRSGSNGYSVGYSYDNAGNRLTKNDGSIQEEYTYDEANKLLEVTNGSVFKSYTYNGAGGVASVAINSATTATIDWDVEGRLVEIVGSGATTYTYNGIGQCVVKSGSTTATYLLADDSIDSPVLDDGSATYHRGNGLIAETRSGNDKFYHADALGTTRAITDSGGSVTDTLTTDAFGLTVSSSGSTPTPFGFAGQHGYQSDADTGLMRLGHRYYDASVGRFLSRDPIQDGYNWYSYCNNDPVNKIDPEGLQEVKVKVEENGVPPETPEISGQYPLLRTPRLSLGLGLRQDFVWQYDPNLPGGFYKKPLVPPYKDPPYGLGIGGPTGNSFLKYEQPLGSGFKFFGEAKQEFGQAMGTGSREFGFGYSQRSFEMSVSYEQKLEGWKAKENGFSAGLRYRF